MEILPERSRHKMKIIYCDSPYLVIYCDSPYLVIYCDSPYLVPTYKLIQSLIPRSNNPITTHFFTTFGKCPSAKSTTTSNITCSFESQLLLPSLVVNSNQVSLIPFVSLVRIGTDSALLGCSLYKVIKL